MGYPAYPPPTCRGRRQVSHLSRVPSIFPQSVVRPEMRNLEKVRAFVGKLLPLQMPLRYSDQSSHPAMASDTIIHADSPEIPPPRAAVHCGYR